MPGAAMVLLYAGFLSMKKECWKKLAAGSLLMFLLPGPRYAPAQADDEIQVTYFANDVGERKPLLTVVPIYPESARRERVEGEVQVCFNVDRKGRTSRARVRTSTNRVFEKPALLAIRASSYEPVPDNRTLSGIKTCRIFRFRLTPVPVDPEN